MSIFKALALLVWIVYGLGVLVYADKLYFVFAARSVALK